MFGEDRILIGSGGIGSALIERGLPIGSPSELWTKERPDAVADVARAYGDAGADYVLTNTFGANRIRLSTVGLSDEVNSLNQRAVELARRSVAPGCRILGSVGPCGEADASAIEEAYQEQVTALVESGVDGFVVETICSVPEGSAAIRAIGSASDLLVAASVTVVENEGGLAILDGKSLAETTRRFADLGVDALGVNCVAPEMAVRALTEIADHTDVPLIAHPNAGLPAKEGDRLRYPETVEEMVEVIASALDLPVTMVGGCCGTDADYVLALHELRGD